MKHSVRLDRGWAAAVPFLLLLPCTCNHWPITTIRGPSDEDRMMSAGPGCRQLDYSDDEQFRAYAFALSDTSRCAPTCKPVLAMELLDYPRRISRTAAKGKGVPIVVRATNRGKVSLWLLPNTSNYAGSRLLIRGRPGGPLEGRWYPAQWLSGSTGSNPIFHPDCDDFVVLSPGSAIDLVYLLPGSGLPARDRFLMKVTYRDFSGVVPIDTTGTVPVIGVVESNIVEVGIDP